MRVLLPLALLLLPALARDDEPEPLPPATHFEENPAPVRLEEMPADPLRWAARRVGLDLDALELPRAWESGYRATARFPPVDAVMNRPLHLKTWAEQAYDLVTTAHADGGLRALGPALAQLRGTDRWPAVDVEAPAADELRTWLAALPLTDEYRAAFTALVEGQIRAQELLDRALRAVDPAVLAWLREHPAHLLAPDGTTMPALTGDNSAQLAFLDHARQVDLRAVLQAGWIAACAVQDYVDATAGWGLERFLSDPQQADRTWSVDTGAGRYVLGGLAGDAHHDEAVLLVDLGGRDLHAHGAGAGLERIAICIDHSGADRYHRPGTDFVQGFGFLGAGLLVDLAGNDRYEAGRFCQGAGIAGLGVVLDLSGDDIHDAQAFCQGAGILGLGALLESGGDEIYDCGTLGQGAASTCGLGLLSDLAGNDRYHLAVDPGKDRLGRNAGHGQGGALSFRALPWRGKRTAYGGAGLLFDVSGNDRYRSNGWCDQGGSYVLSLGALVDGAGHDHYTAHCGQGSGIHVTAAILIDRAGHDRYEGEFRCGGSGGDRSPGIFLDLGGNDVYRSRTASYGTACKPYAFSLFVDRAGVDRYESSGPRGGVRFNDWDSFGGVWPEGEPWHWMWAIALDLGGRDSYEARNRANDSWRHSFGHGIHLDGEWKGEDPVGDAPSPLAPFETLAVAAIPESLRPLADPDLFVRLRGVPGALLGEIVDTLLRSTHRPFSRALLDELHERMERGLTEEDGAQVVRLLDAPDEEVRAVVADDLSIWPVADGVEALREAAGSDGAAAVRRFATRSLRILADGGAPDLARHLATGDPDAAVRREAVVWIARMPEAEGRIALLEAALRDDPDTGVRAAAADALGRLDSFDSYPLLVELSATGDAYLRRALGRARAELGDVDGIGLLIDTLSFPSIDAFENYGTNVPNSIAAYAGHDFPEPERYDARRWGRWFEENRDSIDVRANVAAARAFARLGPLTRETIPQAEALVERYPSWPRLRGALAAALNREAWGMVTAPPASPERDLETGLRWARRAVELDPHPNHVDTLAEALLAIGELDESEKLCREALQAHPGERMFLDRIERIAKLRQGNG